MKEYQIICVDDDEQFLSSLASSLPTRTAPLCPEFECAFEFVASSQELFQLLSESSDGPALAMVISDQMMPGIDGIHLIEKLKAQRLDAVYVLLTGHAGLASAQYAINRHLLDQYVTKPVEDLQEFASLVANLLKGHHLHLEEKQRTSELADTVEQLRVSNEKIRAMHAAAEQVAMLSKGLKSLDFEDVIKLVTDEVPRIFQAEWAVLCFPEHDCPAQNAALIRRRSCPASEEALLTREDAPQAWQQAAILSGEVCASCEKLGGESPNFVIPLTIADIGQSDHRESGQRQGFLCLCRLSEEAKATPDLLVYKGALLREVLSANLTNARLYQQARHDSQTDPLTGAKTRRVLEEKLETEHDRAVRYGHPFCVAIVDVDRFKDINDRAGHVAGDQALRQLTGIFREEIRTTDILARYGGDEFVMLMPETNLDSASNAVERMRRKVEAALRTQGESLTISCGVAEWSGAPEETGTDVLRRADAALYKAKRAGRNRIEIADAA